VLSHLALLADDLLLGSEPSLKTESPDDSCHASVLQSYLFRDLFDACLGAFEVDLIYITAPEPHLYHGQLLKVVDLRLAEMLSELLFVEVGDLWI